MNTIKLRTQFNTAGITTEIKNVSQTAYFTVHSLTKECCFFQNALKNLVFIPFTCLILFFFIFLFKFLPETKNKTIEEITAMFTGGSRLSRQGDIKVDHLERTEGSYKVKHGVDGPGINDLQI